ncbi:hypothetical protein BJX64DRAFT_10174 [Aspergillus heterothallicus]
MFRPCTSATATGTAGRPRSGSEEADKVHHGTTPGQIIHRLTLPPRRKRDREPISLPARQRESKDTHYGLRIYQAQGPFDFMYEMKEGEYPVICTYLRRVRRLCGHRIFPRLFESLYFLTFFTLTLMCFRRDQRPGVMHIKLLSCRDSFSKRTFETQSILAPE